MLEIEIFILLLLCQWHLCDRNQMSGILNIFEMQFLGGFYGDVSHCEEKRLRIQVNSCEWGMNSP